MSAVLRVRSAAAAPARVSHLSVQDVSLVYPSSRGPLAAIERLSIDVAAGEFVSLIGPSGCGKSSLLNLASGLLAPTSGTLRIAGTVVSGPHRDVGIVFQKPTLLPWMTVLQNVLLPIRAMGGVTPAHAGRARELLDLVGLADFSACYPQELSGGMQQRVAIARGLVNEPGLMLMDERSAALDAMTREQTMLELRRIWLATGNSVLFITHSIQEAVFLSDRVVMLSHRPARMMREWNIDLPRARGLETLADPDFNHLSNALRQAFFTL